MTEYYSSGAPKTGMMRIYLKDDFTESVALDDEKVFTGYDLVLTSAMYPSSTLAYAVGYDQTDMTTYVLKYDWNTNTPILWPMKGLSENPNSTPYTGGGHINSIIYATNSNSDDYPVKGYIVGGAKTLWSYSDCVAPQFGFNQPQYENVFTSPNSNAKVGFITRIEVETTSCNRELITSITSISG